MIVRTIYLLVLILKFIYFLVILSASWTEKRVRVKQMGRHDSVLNSKPIGCGKSVFVWDKETFFLLGDKYPITVFFEKESSGEETE